VLTVFFPDSIGGELVRQLFGSWLPDDDRGLYVSRRSSGVNSTAYIFNQLLVLTVAVLITALDARFDLLFGGTFPISQVCHRPEWAFIPFGAILAILVVSILFMFQEVFLAWMRVVQAC